MDKVSNNEALLKHYNSEEYKEEKENWIGHILTVNGLPTPLIKKEWKERRKGEKVTFEYLQCGAIM